MAVKESKLFINFFLLRS